MSENNDNRSETPLRQNGPTRANSRKTRSQIMADKRSTIIESIGEKRIIRVFIEENNQNSKISTTNFKSIAIPVPCPAKFCCELLRLKPSVAAVTTDEYRLVEVHDHLEVRVIGDDEEINGIVDNFNRQTSNEVRKLLYKNPSNLKKVIRTYIVVKKEEMMKSLLITSNMTVKQVCSLLSSKIKLVDTSKFQFFCQFDQANDDNNNNDNNNDENNENIINYNHDKYLITLSREQTLYEFVNNCERDKKIYKLYYTEPDYLQFQQIITVGFRIKEVNKYEVIGVLGKGGFGRVFKVRDRASGDIFAMKVMKKDLIIEKDMTNHINIELDIMSQVNHPFVIRLLHSFQTSIHLYFIIEYLEGGSLFDLVRTSSAPFSEEKSRFYACQIVSGLEALHAHNIVYRDLKLENILLDRDGNIRLTDFGLSHFISEGKEVYSFSGTAIYLAPEILNDLPNEQTVDWWCFGVSIYLILCLEPPFWHENHADLWNEIKLKEPDYAYQTHLSSVSLNFLKELLVKDPKRRLGYEGVEQVKQHPFFASVDWDDVLHKRIHAPIIPPPVSSSHEIHIPKNDLEEVFGTIELEDDRYVMVDNSIPSDNSSQFPSFQLVV